MKARHHKQAQRLYGRAVKADEAHGEDSLGAYFAWAKHYLVGRAIRDHYTLRSIAHQLRRK